jgi:hypothetical protein
MPRIRGKIVKLNLRVDAELKDALDTIGFADVEHFVNQSVRALLEAHRSQQRIRWPIALETSGVDYNGGNTPIASDFPPKAMTSAGAA